MTQLDFAIYAVHGGFWTAFGITRRIVDRGGNVAATGPTVETPVTAPFSRSALAVHFVAFGLMYMSIGSAVFSHRVPAWFTGQRIVGTLVIAAGAWIMCWSLLYFRSWRFRAQLDAGHELATGGPFALVRHPIYTGLNLLALGTAVWIPTMLTWVAVALMLLGSDLRGRAEEHALGEAFGDEYQAYRARTKRFVPGIY